MLIRRYARPFAGGSTVQLEINSNAFNKLARTYASHVETLKRHRAKDEQRVVVEHQHVHVYPGGQALVGTLNQGGGVAQEIKDQPHERDEPLRISQREAVPGLLQTNGAALLGAGGDGLERLPLPRRSRVFERFATGC